MGNIFGGDDYRQRITLQLNTISTVETSDGQSKRTNLSGVVEFDFNKELTLIGFHAIPDDTQHYDELHFEHNFQPTLNIILPPKPQPIPDFEDWHSSTPEAENVSAAILAELEEEWFEDAVMIRNDGIFWWRGNITDQQQNLASVCRFWLNLLWGAYFRSTGADLSVLDQPVSSLPSPSAQTVPSHITIKAMLTYTTSGAYHYSDGDYWALQHRILEELYAMPVWQSMNEQVMAHLGGTTFGNVETSDDHTNRVYGSLLDLCRGARLLFTNGTWNGVNILTEEYRYRTTAGGPDGTGVPEPREGYQTHLVFNESAWEDGYDMVMTGVPNDTFMARSSKSYIIGIPSKNFIMAGHGPNLWEKFSKFQDLFLPTIVRALQ